MVKNASSKDGAFLYGVQGSGWRVQGGGASHKNMEAPRSLDKRCPRIVIPTEVEESFSFAAYHRMSGGTQMGSLLSKAGSTVFHARETPNNVQISAATKIPRLCSG